MSWLSDLLNPGRSYDKASDKYNQYYQQAQGYGQPYMERGNAAGGDLQSMLQKLMNPGALQNEWSKGYEESPYAKQLLEENKGAGMDAASSMGLVGSSGALSNIQRGAGDIQAKDRQQYMNDLMEKYKTAMGIGENLSGTGANMATNMSNNAMNAGQNQAGLEFGKGQAGSNFLGQILGMLGGLGGQYLTGGFGSGGFGRGSLTPDWMNPAKYGNK